MIRRNVFYLTLLPILCGIALAARAQRPTDNVKWSVEPIRVSASSAQVKLSAAVQDGWHVYALSQPAGGPTPLKITVPTGSPYALEGPVAETGVVRHQDPNFNMETIYYLKAATFHVGLKPTGSAPADTAPIDVRFQACSDRLCLPPYTAHLTATLKRK